MESWSFPPDYDNVTMPNLDSRYWFPKRETMDPSAREAAIVERIREVMQYAYANAPFYRQKWDEAGIHPDHINSLETFERVPVVTKAELCQSQEAFPPFGNYLVRSRGGSPSYSRNLGHDRPADGIRHRTQGLADHSKQSGPGDVGHGAEARRHHLYRLRVQSLHGLVGDADRV